MSPKEKAIDLVDTYGCVEFSVMQEYIPRHFELAKSCAIIAVDELTRCTTSINGRPPNYQTVNEYCSEYWMEVKSEIEKL